MSQPTEVEVLLFDLGGVVLEIDWEPALRHWAQHSRLPIEQLRRRFVFDGAYEAHERGEVPAASYFAHLRGQLEMAASDDEIAHGWNAIFVGEIAHTLDMIEAARDRLPCFAFSNTNATHQVTWSRHYPRTVAAFERVFASSELGMRKPEREAFDSVSEAMGTRSANILFFDDLAENVDAARAAGLQAVQVRGPADVRQALQAIGIL